MHVFFILLDTSILSSVHYIAVHYSDWLLYIQTLADTQFLSLSYIAFCSLTIAFTLLAT